MKLPVVLRLLAQRELDAAVDWYNQKSPAAARRFVNQLQGVFDQIAANPFLHRIVFKDIRRSVVRRFPYCVYYRALADRVEVVSVFHTSRDPAIWKTRADEFEKGDE